MNLSPFLQNYLGRLVLLFCFPAISNQLSEAQAPETSLTQAPPPMGWSSWSSTWSDDNKDHFNEDYIKAQADVMASKLKSSGYIYINLDAGWDKGIDEHGRPQVNIDRFPNGIVGLAKYVHGQGLKLGIYLTPGISAADFEGGDSIVGTSFHLQDIVDKSQPGNTTGHAFRVDYTKPGSKEYIQSCANLFASWDVDYIKMDFVGPGGGNVKADTREDIKQWHEAIQKCGRPIWLGLSNSLSFDNVTTWKNYSNGWRIEGDIEAYDHLGKLTNWNGVKARFDDVPKWAEFAGPGGWNDLDSLEVGQGDTDGLTADERKTAMTLWSISCAPLLLGADLTKLDDSDLALLTNDEVIAVDQAGHVATPLSQKAPQQIWRAQNPDGSQIVALFNLGDKPEKVSVAWADLGMRGTVSVRDLWQRTDLGTFDSTYEATLLAHGCQLLKVRQ